MLICKEVNQPIGDILFVFLQTKARSFDIDESRIVKKTALLPSIIPPRAYVNALNKHNRLDILFGLNCAVLFLVV